jgi:hypothetical protein
MRTRDAEFWRIMKKWDEQERRLAYEEAFEKGVLMGQIVAHQEWHGLPVDPIDVLGERSMEELQALVDNVRAQILAAAPRTLKVGTTDETGAPSGGSHASRPEG